MRRLRSLRLASAGQLTGERWTVWINEAYLAGSAGRRRQRGFESGAALRPAFVRNLVHASMIRSGDRVNKNVVLFVGLAVRLVPCVDGPAAGFMPDTLLANQLLEISRRQIAGESDVALCVRVVSGEVAI
jgi:hypothetical protein